MAKSRLKEIEALIQERHYLSLQELVNEFNVSESTIRRDFQRLERQGILSRNHGGAVITASSTSEKNNFVLPISITNHEEKKRMGAEAARIVNDGEIIAIGSGTTCLVFSRFLHAKKDLTVITNNAYVAVELSFHENIKVIATCGIVSHLHNCSNMIGSYSIDFLRNFFVEKLFCSVIGINFEMGYSDINFTLADSWKAMLNISTRSYLLAEQQKFDKHGYVSLGKLNCVHEVFTTSGIPHAYVNHYEKLSIPVHICE